LGAGKGKVSSAKVSGVPQALQRMAVCAEGKFDDAIDVIAWRFSKWF
jgi:hypothetical protein